MSHNLYLIGDHDAEMGLRQTPTYVTRDAMKIYDTGSSGDIAAEHAVKVYKSYLLSCGDDPEEVDVEIRKIEAFIAFVPGARFVSS
jgi:hypothetical protein